MVLVPLLTSTGYLACPVKPQDFNLSGTLCPFFAPGFFLTLVCIIIYLILMSLPLPIFLPLGSPPSRGVRGGFLIGLLFQSSPF